MKTTLPALLALTTAALAGGRTSASYTVATDTADTGGRRTTSTSYSNDGSAGGITGLSTAAAPAETVKHGFAGQLYDATALTLTAPSTSVNEGASLPLGAWLALDDATFLTLPAAGIAWSVPPGPLAINPGGLATAGAVYQNTPATVQGSYRGTTGTLALTVLNVFPDNFGAYAADGLDDSWQVQYFGQNNPLAAPAADPDADGHPNLFEYNAGLVPTDPASRFHFRIEPVANDPTQWRFVLSPVLAGRTYTLEYNNTLDSTTWHALPGTTPSDTGNERTLIAPNDAEEPRKFYRVTITRP